MISEAGHALSSPKRPIWHAPLLPVALGMIFGIAIENALAPPSWAWVVVAAPACLLILLQPTRRTSTLAAVFLAATALGGARHYVALRVVPEDHISTLAGREPALVTVVGEVASEPRIIEPDPSLPRAYPTPPKTRFILNADEVEGPQGALAASGNIRVTVREPAPTIRPGERLRMTGWLYEQPGPANPGGYDWSTHFRRQGLQMGLSLDHAAGLQHIDVAEPHSASAWRDALRTRMKRYLLDPAFEENEPESGVIAAMVLGERSAVPKALNEAFVQTGNAHFLAASGMHVGLLAFVVWSILRILGIPHRAGACVLAVVIVMYVLLAEPRPSILRAGIVGVLGCLTILLQTRPNVLNWLSLAAIVILLIDPTDCFRPAFQLSFVAVLAIVYVRPRIAESIAAIVRRSRRPDVVFYFLPGPTSADPVDESWLIQAHAVSFARQMIRRVVQLFLVALAVWLTVVPLSCFHFHQFTPWGPINTMILWLIAAPMTCLGFLTMLLGAVLPTSGRLLGPLLDCGTDAMVCVVQLLAKMPGTVVEVRPPSVSWTLAVYAALILWTIRPGGLGERRHVFKVAAAVLLLWWWLPLDAMLRSSDRLDMWVLAVGDGSAVVLELPNDETWVFDLGTRSNMDAGRTAADFLRSRDIGRINTAIVSHPNFDHYGGISTLAHACDIKRVLVNGHFESLAAGKPKARRFLDDLRAGGIAIEALRAPGVLTDSDDLRIETLWPPPPADLHIADANESSTVLAITYQGHRIILTGDNDEVGLAALSDMDGIAADVLLLPHHGAVVQNTAALIGAVDPRYVLRSSGRRHFASSGTLEAIVEGRVYLNTADAGCIRVTIADGDIRVRSRFSGD